MVTITVTCHYYILPLLCLWWLSHVVALFFIHVQTLSVSYNRWLRSKPMWIAIAGVANQSETKSHISYCVTAKSHIMYIIHHWAHMNISSSLPHSHAYFCWPRFIVNITHHQHSNDRTLQGIHCYVCYLVWLLICNYVIAAWNWAKSYMWLARHGLVTAVLLHFSVSVKWNWTCIWMHFDMLKLTASSAFEVFKIWVMMLK